jgi:D-hexose-6-phosphate mutarotase/predicted GNAT family N-acyltransferase
VRVTVVNWQEAEAALSSIRREVFIEEQQVPEELEWDGEDAHALHVLVVNDGEPIGCGRMLADGHIGRMAVLENYRGKGVGRLILKTLLMEAEKLRRGRVFLNAQTRAAGFYAKYGFNPVGGEFPDANIPHVRMEKTLDNFSETLNARFAIPGRLRFQDSGPGLPVAEITTPDAMARVAVQGGQVLEWQPSGQKPVIWVSKAAVHQPGKGVRGGVPVCWPWFGQLEGKGVHGFVRTRMWEVREARLDMADTVVLRLGIREDESTRAQWDHAFDLELIVTVGAALKMELVTRNTGNAPFTITDGLHTYFRVGDIHQTKVHGLDGTSYFDKVRDFQQSTQSGPVTFSEETDRVYFNTTADCLIEDPVFGRTIRVAKAGSGSSVVWNPWTEKERGFADMAAGEYADMVCVETVNASPDEITIAPGGKHSLVAFVGVE